MAHTPNKQDYEKFKKNYKGSIDVDRAYMAAATGNKSYHLRRDLYPGQSVNNLPDTEDSPAPTNPRNRRY